MFTGEPEERGGAIDIVHKVTELCFITCPEKQHVIHKSAPQGDAGQKSIILWVENELSHSPITKHAYEGVKQLPILTPCSWR